MQYKLNFCRNPVRRVRPFDQLGQYYIESTKSTTAAAKKAAIEKEIAGVKANLEYQRSRGEEEASKRTVAPQLTVQRLALALGEERMCWVIEDFHKVPEEEKRPLAQAFKIFRDVASSHASVKIVAIGATETAREVVEYDREMRHRVAEILVPVMTPQELDAIITQGERYMNIRISSFSHDSISKFSAGLASVCHHICLNLCLTKNIDTTARGVIQLGEDALTAAVARYVEESSDTVKSVFDLALIRHRVRQYDNCRLIVSALAKWPLDGLLNSQILAAIREQYPKYPQSNLTTYLRELLTDRRGAVLRHSPDGRYRFSDPIYHAYTQGIFLSERDLGKEVERERERMLGISFEEFFLKTVRRQVVVSWGENWNSRQYGKRIKSPSISTAAMSNSCHTKGGAIPPCAARTERAASGRSPRGAWLRPAATTSTGRPRGRSPGPLPTLQLLLLLPRQASTAREHDAGTRSRHRGPPDSREPSQQICGDA